jgi:undecaprenol kinase
MTGDRGGTPESGPSGVRRSGFWRSFSFAGQGAWRAAATQRNVRVQLAAALVTVLAGLIVRISAVDWACVATAIGLVLTAETLNTAIEALVDLSTEEVHPLAKAAKDMAAGAVLIASLAAVGVAAAVFLPHLLSPGHG